MCCVLMCTTVLRNYTQYLCVCTTSQVLHTVVRSTNVPNESLITCITYHVRITPHYTIVVYTLHFDGENTPQQTLQPIAVFPLVLFKNSFVAYSLYIWYSAKEYDG